MGRRHEGKMRFVENIEAERFDRFVEGHPLGSFQQGAAWGELHARQRGPVYRVGLEEAGALKAAVQLLTVPFRDVERSYLWAPGGFLIDFEDRPQLEQLAAPVRELAAGLGGVFVRISPVLRYRSLTLDGEVRGGGEDNSWLIGSLGECGFEHTGFEWVHHKTTPRFLMWIDLAQGLEAIWDGFAKKTRQYVRAAERRGIEIVEGRREDLERFAQLMDVTGQRADFHGKASDYFLDLHDLFTPAGKLGFLLARYDPAHEERMVLEELAADEAALARSGGAGGEAEACRARIAHARERLEQCRRERAGGSGGTILAGAIAIACGPRVACLFGPSDDALRDHHCSHLLQWEMMRWAARRGADRFDMRGAGRPWPDSPWYGLYWFKRGFRGELVEPIGEFDLVLDRDAHAQLLDKSTDLGRSQKKLFKDLRTEI